MNTAAQKKDALRNALVLAGQRLASTGIHGRFRITRRGLATYVSFFRDGGNSTRIDIRALGEAIEHARSAGFKAERFGLKAWVTA